MYTHLLAFSKNDRIRLQELYEEFIRQLEKSQGMDPEFFLSLKQSLSELLHLQTGLRDFLDRIQQNPLGTNHLHLTHKDKSILNLPWQIVFDNTAVHISKGLPAGSFDCHTPKPGPLRILVMISSPEDLDFTKRLSYEEEEQVILKTLGPLWQEGQVQVEFTENGSLRSLQESLQLQHYHILYFGGHGVYKDNTGYLYLENEETLDGELVSAQQFGEVIKAKHEHIPSLIILSACQTAQGHLKDGFQGVADVLMGIGVPAVIAMALSISDEFAILFAGYLYQHLSKRHSLDIAYSSAITAIHVEEQQRLSAFNEQQFPSQWLIPQLYCSQQVDQIVDWQAPGQALKIAVERFIGGEEHLLLSQNKEYRFIGRRRENAFLFSKLIYDKPVLIRGQGGVGKTALAEHLVKRLISQDPSRYCFAFNETNNSIPGMLTRLRSYLEKEGKLAVLEPRLLKNENAFIHLELLLDQVAAICKPVWIFDNVESFQQDIDGPIKIDYVEWMNFVKEKLLNRFPVIFTGRYPIHELPGINEISLNEVSFVDFYRKCLQLSIGVSTDQNDRPGLLETAELLYRMLGGSYRYLEFFDEIYRNDRIRVASILNRLRSKQDTGTHQKELLKEVHEKQTNTAKKIIITSLVDVLNEEEKSTLHFLLYFRIPILSRALEMQLPGKNFDKALQRMERLTLVEQQHSFYYVTQLVRNLLHDVRLPPIEFNLIKAGNYFEYAFEKIAPTYGNMEEAFFYYAKAKDLHKVNQVSAMIVSEYYRVGLYHLVLHYGKEAERIAGIRTHEEVLNNLGLTYLKLGKFDLAMSYLTKFLIIVRRMGLKEQEIIALNNISQVYYQREDFDSALNWLEKSRLAAKENHLLESEGLTLSNIGNIYADRGQLENASKVWRQSLQIRKETGNRQGQIRVMTNIAGIHKRLGEHKKALQMLQKAQSIAAQTGEKRLEGKVLSTIGMTYLDKESAGEALEYLKKSLSISQSIGDEEEMGETLVSMSLAHVELSNFDDAIECLVRGESFLQKMGRVDMDLPLALQFARIELARGDYEIAIATMLHCLPLIRQSGDRKQESQTLMNLGEAYMELGQFDNALIHLQDCIKLNQAIADKEGETMALVRLAQAYSAKNEHDKALEYLVDLLFIQKEIRDLPGQAMTWFNIANSCIAIGEGYNYYKYATKAYNIYKRIGHNEGIFLTGTQLGVHLCTTNHEKELKKGLLLLKKSYKIAQQENYPGIEILEENIKKYIAKYNKVAKKKAKTKSKKA